jgi:hypothetical protein
MEPIDLYCERLGPGLFAEPLNAVTNAAFIVAAWLIWLRARESGKLTPAVWTLLALIVAFGVGSALFHTSASQTTRVLDVLPIALFFIAYLWVYLRRVIGIGFAATLGLVPAFAVVAFLARQFLTLLNGSLTYAPALLVTIGLGVIHQRLAKRSSGEVLAAAAVFGIAIVFRSLDNLVCADFPIGTHFVWHLLTATALYLATRALLANLPSAGAARPVDRFVA